MRLLRFQGYSDDTFGLVNDDDYDNCASGDPIRWRLYSPSAGRGIYVTGTYSPRGNACWEIGVSPLVEDDMTPWPVGIVFDEHPYSPVLKVEAPDDAVVTCMDREG